LLFRDGKVGEWGSSVVKALNHENLGSYLGHLGLPLYELITSILAPIAPTSIRHRGSVELDGA